MTQGASGSEHVERRAHRRYPVELPLRFLIRSGKFLSISGEGTSINISSNGLMFRSSRELSDGEQITAALQWPVMAEGKPMLLLVHGHVIWIHGADVGVSMSHYAFLAEKIPASTDIEGLNKLALPRHLIPTKPNPARYSGVHRWKRGVARWK